MLVASERESRVSLAAEHVELVEKCHVLESNLSMMQEELASAKKFKDQMIKQRVETAKMMKRVNLEREKEEEEALALVKEKKEMQEMQEMQQKSSSLKMIQDLPKDFLASIANILKILYPLK